MTSVFLYIGPGMGIGSIVLILIILAIILFSVGMILWIPIKNLFRRLSGKKR